MESYGYRNPIGRPEAHISREDQEYVRKEKERWWKASSDFIRTFPDSEIEAHEILRSFIKRLGKMSTPAEVDLHRPKFDELEQLLHEVRRDNKAIPLSKIKSIFGDFDEAGKAVVSKNQPKIRRLGE